jgi:hypothetical protein
MTTRPAPVPEPRHQAAEPADSFSRQLNPPGYVLDVRPPSAAARRPAGGSAAGGSAAGGRGKADAGPALPCVVLLSRACDAELDAVGGLLGKVGIATARINADELTGTELLIDPGRGAIRRDGRWLAPTVVWKRHFSARAIEGSARPAYDLFRRDSWRAVAGQLAALSSVALGMRSPGLLEQRLVAQGCRVAVPRTVVATDPAAAAEFLGQPRRLVVKALDQHFVEASPGRLSGVFPVVVNARELPSAPRPGPPVIVQEYVEHDAELRVYYVDGRVHGFEVGKEAAADPWLAADRVTVRPAELSETVVTTTTTLAQGLSLRYGAFDFLLQGDRPVFLEVNPDGDWLWAEAKARTAVVTQAVAHMLCALHRGCGPAPVTAGGPVAGGFDLISFLGP